MLVCAVLKLYTMSSTSSMHRSVEELEMLASGGMSLLLS